MLSTARTPSDARLKKTEVYNTITSSHWTARRKKEINYLEWFTININLDCIRKWHYSHPMELQATNSERTQDQK
jgi:hypothetical protein